MIEGENYFKAIKKYFSFLISDFEMELLDEKERGNVFYHIKFGDKDKVVSISYENIEDYLQIIVFMLNNGELPDYDDKTKTLHLNAMNANVLPNTDKKEIALNAQYFSKYYAESDVEKRLLKGAKELRLCLYHFNQISQFK